MTGRAIVNDPGCNAQTIGQGVPQKNLWILCEAKDRKVTECVYLICIHQSSLKKTVKRHRGKSRTLLRQDLAIQPLGGGFDNPLHRKSIAFTTMH
jgi:hypothetical protein